jgi:hypothetical protein
MPLSDAMRRISRRTQRGMTLLNDYLKPLEKSGVLEPSELAERILAGLSKPDAKSLLAEVLPGAIATAQSRERMRPSRTPTMTSGKVAAQRAMFSPLFHVVIPLASGRKLLADCVKGDLLEYAETLRTHARMTMAKADEYERMANELPDDTTTVIEAFG